MRPGYGKCEMLKNNNDLERKYNAKITSPAAIGVWRPISTVTPRYTICVRERVSVVFVGYTVVIT